MNAVNHTADRRRFAADNARRLKLGEWVLVAFDHDKDDGEIIEIRLKNTKTKRCHVIAIDSVSGAGVVVHGDKAREATNIAVDYVVGARGKVGDDASVAGKAND
jgi:hypothetical protein